MAYRRNSVLFAVPWSIGQRDADGPCVAVLPLECGRQIGDRLAQAATQLR
nr:hypothetical protein GCM10020092_056360 [Actinoplanes digitatis]